MTGWVFDRVPLRANAYARHRGWQRRLWEKAAWVKAIEGLAGKGPYKAESPPKASLVRLAITMRRSSLQDPDNRYGCLKPVLDALKATGWIYDDSETWCQLHVFEEKCKRGEESTWVVWDHVNGGVT